MLRYAAGMAGDTKGFRGNREANGWRRTRGARGSLPVFLHIRDGAGKWLRLKANDDLRINPTVISKADLETILGAGRVEFSRQGNGSARG